MKTILLFFQALILLLLQGQVSAQINTKITFGEEFNKQVFLNEPLLYNDDGIYALCYNSLNYANISYFNSNLGYRNTDDNQAVTFFSVNDELYSVSVSNDPDKKINYVYYKAIDKSSLEEMGDPQLIATIGYENKFDMGYLGYDISSDKSKIMFFYNIPDDKKENERFGISVYNRDMENLWKGEYTLPYLNNLFDIDEFLVNNKGEAYVSGFAFNEKRKYKSDGESNYTYSIYTITHDGIDFTEKKLSIKDKFIKKATIRENVNGDVYCMGIYGVHLRSTFSGVFCHKMENEVEANIENTYKVELKYVTNGFTGKYVRWIRNEYKRDGKEDLLNYNIRQVIVYDDGSISLIIEQYRDIVSSSSTSTSIRYYHGPIIVSTFSPDGKLKWMNSIPKLQIAYNKHIRISHASFSAVNYNDELYIFYNDHPKNINLPDGKACKKAGTKSNLIAVKFNKKDGTYSKQTLYEYPIFDKVAYPYQCIQNDNIIYMMCCYTHVHTHLSRLMKIEILD